MLILPVLQLCVCMSMYEYTCVHPCTRVWSYLTQTSFFDGLVGVIDMNAIGIALTRTAFLCWFDSCKYLCVVYFLEYSFLRLEGK